MSFRFILVLLSFTVAAWCQENDPSLITLDRLHGSGDFGGRGFGPVRWLEDGSGYTTLESSPKGGRDIVRYDPGSGERTILVQSAQLVPQGRKSPLGISDYTWSDDGKKLLVFTNTRRVWRYNTRGDYWVLDRGTGKLQQVAPSLDETRLQFAKFSPDGGRVGFVYRNDIYVENLADGKITRLTDNGTDTLINGTFDWVYEEEWGLRDGFRWSPDGRRIAYWQIDSSGVSEFILINNTSGLYPKLTRIPYPKVGETNPAARVGVVAAGGGATTWVDLPGDLRNDYIARMEWADSPDELVIQRVNRLQNTIRVMFANAETGSSREVFRDEDKTWCEVCDDLVWLENGGRFTWLSERDGWKHIYVVSRDGSEVRNITPGDYDVVSIARIDEAGGGIYFIASPDDPTCRYLYRVPIKGGAPVRITPASLKGTHQYQVSQDARWAIHTGSSFASPPRIGLVKLPGHEVVRTFVDNARLAGTVAKLKKGPMKFFKVEVDDGVEVDGWSIFPPDFDPSKKYPLFIYVYGEPAGQTTVNRWGGGNYFWHLMLAQRGYIVVSFDNRGTPSPKGRAWRKSIYRQIGILASRDQAAALRALQEKWDFLDRDRVGIWGWSGGGSMSLNAIFRYPGLYHTAMAIAFIANQRYYDTIYQERYMGLPKDNKEGFRDGSPITFAKNLKGNLLLVYGTGDDNCHYQNCEALVDELVAHQKMFSMMAYPNRSHGIYEGRGTRKHLFTTLTRYLETHLPAGPR